MLKSRQWEQVRPWRDGMSVDEARDAAPWQVATYDLTSWLHGAPDLYCTSCREREGARTVKRLDDHHAVIRCDKCSSIAAFVMFEVEAKWRSDA